MIGGRVINTDKNNAIASIIYPDVPQNCGDLRANLYKYDEDAGDKFTVNEHENETDWICTGLRNRLRATSFDVPNYVIIKANASKTFTIKLMEITIVN
ncbi:unnamed protein product [Rotaria sp. Silwood2]|nr:unnamed protein product [Rotaria sp. Silwood2]